MLCDRIRGSFEMGTEHIPDEVNVSELPSMQQAVWSATFCQSVETSTTKSVFLWYRFKDLYISFLKCKIPFTQTKQNKTKQSKTKQSKAKQSKAKQSKAKQGKAKQNKTK